MRLIDADELTEMVWRERVDSRERIAELIARQPIIKAPMADAKSAKRGYWIKQPEKFQIHEDVINSNYLYSCSCCNASDLHSERANNDGEVKFCWRCGAKMDAEPEEKPKEQPKKKAPAKKQEPASELTADDLIRVITQKIKQNRANKDKVLTLLKSYGAAKVSDIPADKYEAFLTDVSQL